MIGIYKIENLVNGKKYIGQSWDIERRWKEEKNRYCNNHLAASFNKYGLENFSFKIIDTVKDDAIAQLLLDAIEKMYIDKLNTCNPLYGYNKDSGGANGKPTDETRKKMSNAQAGKNHPMYGKRHSEKTRQKMSAARTGEKNPMSGKHHSDETKQKISAANKNPSVETRAKISVSKIGKHHSDKTRAKMSASQKLRYQKGKDV